MTRAFALGLLLATTASAATHTHGSLVDAWVRDAVGRVVKQTPSDSPPTFVAYGTDGRPKTATYGFLPLAEVTSTTYDIRGRPLDILTPDGRTLHREYDGRGLPLLETYGVGSDVTRTDFTWDDEGKPLTRTKGGKHVAFDYGPQGELRSLTQPDGTQWKYGYDARARLNAMTPPTGSVINTQSWVYDGLGRVKVHTDGARSWETHWNNGVATTLLPGGALGGFSSLTDSRGRLLELSSVAGLSAPSVSKYSFFYDGLDALRVTSEVAASGSQRADAHSMYELDSSRRLSAVTGRGDDVSFTYDGASTRPLTRTHSTGGRVTSHYDALARLDSLQGPWGTTAVSWEPGGQRLRGLQDALVNETFHFDARGRLDSIGNGFSPVRVYGFDDRDNPISESAGGLTRQFGYDDNDRLVATREWDGTIAVLTLTADGSRSTETVFPPSTPWGVLPSAPGFLSKKRFDYGPASGALEAVVDITNAASPVPLASWSYDSAGRATSRTSGGSTVSMQWDVFDRLVSGGGARFEYDGLGLRRAAVDGNGTRRFTYVGESLLAEDSALTASVAGFKVGMGGVRFGHDALGSVVQQVSASASSSARFSAWGKPLSGPQLTDVAFTGHLSESNLPAYDAQQRWLDKDFGVFLSRDSIGASSYLSSPNGMGPHSYANLSPGRYTDPDGREGVGDLIRGCVQGIELDSGTGRSQYGGKRGVRFPMCADPSASFFTGEGCSIDDLPTDADMRRAFLACRPREGMATNFESHVTAPIRDSQVGKDTREWWYGGETRQKIIGGVFGSVSGGTGAPLPSSLPPEAQETAQMMRFSVAAATAVVTAGRGLAGLGNMRLPPSGPALAIAGGGASAGTGSGSISASASAAVTTTVYMAAAAKAAGGGKRRQNCVKPTIKIPKSRFSALERAELQYYVNEGNKFLKQQPGIVGDVVTFNPKDSIRWIRDVYFPEKNLADVRVSDLSELMGFDVQIDEARPRFLGGFQTQPYQRAMPSLMNSYLGQAESHALKDTSIGTCVEGFVLEFE